MKFLSFLILLTLQSFCSGAQNTFQKSYSSPADDYGAFVTVMTDNGVAISGSSVSSGNRMSIIRTDSNGDTVFTRYYDSGDIYGGAILNNGKYIVVSGSYADSLNTDNILLMKMD